MKGTITASATDQSQADALPGGATNTPRVWHEAPPAHFDTRIAWWIKALIVILLAAVAYWYLDKPVAAWAMAHHPLPELSNPKDKHDIARELMLLEQWGQWTASVLVVGAVVLLDPAGRRRGLAIALGCIVTVAVTYLVKDLCGRSRPLTVFATWWTPGDWMWGGWQRGFHGGSAWTSFPSAHTTGAFALAAGLSWFYPRGRGLFMLLAVITAVQRVLHAAHFVSDVIVGMGLAVFAVRWTLRMKLAGRLIALAPEKARMWWMGQADSP